MCVGKKGITRDCSVILNHPDAYRVLVKRLRVEMANRLGQMTRNECMAALRAEEKWSLRKVGSLFGISYERVRQLTSPGICDSWARVKYQHKCTETNLRTGDVLRDVDIVLTFVGVIGIRKQGGYRRWYVFVDENGNEIVISAARLSKLFGGLRG